MTGRGAEGDFRLFARHRSSSGTISICYGSLAVDHRQATFFSQYPASHPQAIFALLDLCGGLPGAPVRRAGLRVRLGGISSGTLDARFLVTIVIMGLSTFRGRPPARAAASDRRRGADPSRSRCACSRAWRLAANMAVRRSMSLSMRRADRRGFYTAWIQTTATRRSAPVARRDPRDLVHEMLASKDSRPREGWPIGGWRIPFLLSMHPARHLGLDSSADE